MGPAPPVSPAYRHAFPRGCGSTRIRSKDKAQADGKSAATSIGCEHYPEACDPPPSFLMTGSPAPAGQRRISASGAVDPQPHKDAAFFRAQEPPDGSQASLLRARLSPLPSRRHRSSGRRENRPRHERPLPVPVSRRVWRTLSPRWTPSRIRVDSVRHSSHVARHWADIPMRAAVPGFGAFPGRSAGTAGTPAPP